MAETIKVSFHYEDDEFGKDIFDYTREREVLHNLPIDIVEECQSFLRAVGHLDGVAYGVQYIDWNVYQFKTPTDVFEEYAKDCDFILTLDDKSTVIGHWDGKHFVGFEDDEVKAWCEFPYAYEEN